MDPFYKTFDQPESSILEYKRELPKKEVLLATLCALANTAGGEMIIGADDKGRPVGLEETGILELEQRLSSWITDGIRPLLLPLIQLRRTAQGPILAIQVGTGSNRPYGVVGGSGPEVFVRIGSSTRKADAATIERMRLQSQGRTWDGLPAVDATLDMLDVGLIREFWSVRHGTRGIPIPKSGEKDWLLKNRFAYSESTRVVPTNAGILFFHQSPQEILPQARVEMARFDGANARNFLDKQSLDGPLWKLPELALQFMKRHIPIRAARGRLQRSEGLAYPEAAFREFFLNALCHRAYEGSSGSVRVAFFDDVVEITNPGSLPDGLQLNDLGTGISMLRNPVLARGFSEIGLIEGWGTGIQVAMEALKHASLPPAVFNLKGFFTQVSSNWRWATNLPEAEQNILTLAAKLGSITTADVVTHLDTSDRSARRILQSLVTQKYLKKSGTTKAAAYRLHGAGR